MLPEIMKLHKMAVRQSKGGEPSRDPDNNPDSLFPLAQNAYSTGPNEISPINTSVNARLHITCPERCPACKSGNLLYLRGVRPTFHFQREYVPILYCQNCGTICTPHNVTLEAHDPELKWHMSVESRNRNAARKLFAEVKQYHWGPVHGVLEIGCGPGWLLSELSSFTTTVGYETNPYCVSYGREKLGLDIRNELFNAATEAQFDILFCISTIEHIEDPDELLFAISESCKRNKASACLFVPFYSDVFIKYIHNTFERATQNPFWTVPAHVVHYTKLGFLELLKRFGGYDFQHCRANGVWGATLCKFKT